MLLEKSCLKLILCFRVGVILRRLSALPLAYTDHERWCFSDSWDHTAWRYIQGTRAKSLLLSSLPGVFTLGLTESICVQGNQMTLVYMEREYSSPEDPHVGIVHLVEVKNLVPKKKKSLQMHSCCNSSVLILIAGEFQARSDGELCVPWGADDGVGGAGVPTDQSAALSVCPVCVTARCRAGGGRQPVLWSPCKQCWNLSMPRKLSRRLLSGSVL